MQDVVVVDLFCGAGGLTCGLEAAGLNVIQGVDIDERCGYIYEKNTSSRFMCKDIRQYGAEHLQNVWNSAKYRILVGCAPCQSFSTYSQRRSGKKRDGRGDLIHRFASLVQATLPDVVSMENVPPIVQTEDFQLFENCFERCGILGETRGSRLPRDRTTPDASQVDSLSLAIGAVRDERIEAIKFLVVERRRVRNWSFTAH